MIYRVNVITGIYRPRVLSVPTFRRTWELRASLSRYRTILPLPLPSFFFFLFSQKNSSFRVRKRKRSENFNVGFVNYISGARDPMSLWLLVSLILYPGLDFSRKIMIGGSIWRVYEILQISWNKIEFRWNLMNDIIK